MEPLVRVWNPRCPGLVLIIILAVFTSPCAGSGFAAETIQGEVLGANAPIAKSTVTLWSASADAPKQLAQAQTNDDGRFSLSFEGPSNGPRVLYVIAKGGEPNAHKGGGDNRYIAMLSVIGPTPPAHVTINEFTTVASVWTNAQFLDGGALRGAPLGLKIAAGNVPSLVDLQTGGWGTTIQDSLNSSQTPTMANFATLADLLCGCVTLVTADACGKLFAAATPPKGATPTDTLTAAESIARYPWYQPKKLFVLLGELYPVPAGKTMRAVPYMPYLNFSPSAWVLPLEFDGGGYRAGGKAMFDSGGNLWVGDNFTIGWQAQDALWQGNATKFNPNGKPLSPITTGFAGAACRAARSARRSTRRTTLGFLPMGASRLRYSTRTVSR